LRCGLQDELDGITVGFTKDDGDALTTALFAWLISHQPAELFSQSKSTTSSQPAVLFSQNKPAPAISHQPNEMDVHSNTKEGDGRGFHSFSNGSRQRYIFLSEVKRNMQLARFTISF
jgi:hypothetical protein